MNLTPEPLQRLVLFIGTLLLLLSACTKKSAPLPNDASHVSTVAPVGSHDATCVQMRAGGTVGTIDDFESDPNRLAPNEGRDGYWFEYNDGTGGKLLREEVTDPRMLHIRAHGFSNWGAGAGVQFLASTSLDQACAYDASAYTGVRFRARGRGRTRVLLVGVKNVPSAEGGRCTRPGPNCYDSPGVWVNLSEQWQTLELPFCSFHPVGWGGDLSGLDPSELVNLQFRFDAHANSELWLDDLAFFAREQGAAPANCGPKCPLELVPPFAKLAPATSNVALTDGLSLHTLQQSTKSCGMLTRRYFSYVPKQLEPKSSAPVLMVLHGSEANAESMQQYMTHGRFDQLAMRDGFIVVYGNAAPGAHMSTSVWLPNSGSWRQTFYDDGEVDDVAYLLSVLDDLKVRGVTSGNSPVYLTGISNGGGMVLEAAKRAPERFRGIAPLMAYDGMQPTPVPELHGKGLNRVLFMYAVKDPGLPDGYDEVLQALPPMWARALGLSADVIDNPKRTELPDRIREGSAYNGKSKVALATRNSRAVQYDFVAPGNDAQLRLIVFDHAGHFWPTPVGDVDAWAVNRWGFRNQDVDAADLVWDFFSVGSAR